MDQPSSSIDEEEREAIEISLFQVPDAKFIWSDKETKSKLVEKSLNNLSLEAKGKSIETTIPSIIPPPPPPPPGPLSPATTAQKSPSSLSLERSSDHQDLDTKREEVEKKKEQEAKEIGVEDYFGDFQAAD